MPGFLEVISNQRENLPLAPTYDNCRGKTFIVVGSNTGLGFEAAKHLVRFKSAKVIMACRSLARGETAKEAIEKETGNVGIAEVWQCDLGDYESVTKFAKRVETLERLDAAILNASLAFEKYATADKFEITLGVNVIGNFLLAHLIMPKLSETASKTGKKSVLTIVGSDTAFWVPNKLEAVPKGDFFEEMSKESFGNRKDFYPMSKLIQLYALREMAARNPVSRTGVIIDYVNPGLCYSDLNRGDHVSWLMRKQIDLLRWFLARTTEMGSRTLLAGAFADVSSHGAYHSECKRKEERITPWMTNESGKQVQQRIWSSLTGHLNKIQPGLVA